MKKIGLYEMSVIIFFVFLPVAGVIAEIFLWKSGLRATLNKMETSGWDKVHYLSLSGTSPLALLQYLTDHPSIDRISLGLDNGEAGIKGMVKILAMAGENEILRCCSLTTDPPPKEYGKDYNLMLQRKLAETQPKHERNFSR